MNGRHWLIVSFLSFQLAVPPALAVNEGRALEQFSDISGEISVIWTKDAVRVNFKKYDVVFITRAPAWRVIVFSDSTKRYCESTLEQFRGRFGQAHYRRDKNDKVLKANKTTKIAGLNASEYILARAKKSGAIDLSDMGEMWMTKELNMPRPIGKLLSEVASMPANLGIPVRAIRVRNRGITVKTLDTLAYHKVPINADTFSWPKGYMKVSDEVAVLIEEDMDSLIELPTDVLSKDSGKRERNALLNEYHPR
jgi:hypothetical protein